MTAAESPPISPKRALPILLEQQSGQCARCGCRLIGHGWHDEGRIVLDDEGTWTCAAGYESPQVNHKTPRSAGGRNVLPNYEATCGPCNLAHWREWKATR